MKPIQSEATTYQIVRETWLTRKPAAGARVVATIATLLLILASLIFLFDVGGFGRLMEASYMAVYVRHEWWRLWTTLFAHGDIGHWASNVMLFFILGFFLNGYFGWRMFPAGALLWGGAITLSVLPTYEPQTTLIGMSGVVYWMGGAWLVLYFFLSRQKSRTERWMRTLGVAILIFMPAETFEPHVSYRTHFTGFLLGMCAGGVHYLLHRVRFLAAEVRETIVEQDETVV
jgi:rhomboid protease GluP